LIPNNTIGADTILDDLLKALGVTGRSVKRRPKSAGVVGGLRI
jgi:hypothetical protein